MIRFEMALLDELGFGLDLSACAATGAREELERQKNGDQGKGTEGSSRAISSG